MKKKILRIIAVILFFVVAGGIYYINSLNPIITGYAAKNLASGVFVAHRTQASMEKTDLNFSFIRFTHNKVDYAKKEVTSRFLWAKSKAIYIKGFGCTLVRQVAEKVIQNRPYAVVPLPDINPDSVAWPAGDKLSDTIPHGLNINLLDKAVDHAFYDSTGTKGTFAVAVAYKNQLVAEKYRTGFSAHNLFLSWSMAKSYTNALVGIMVKEGKLDINKSDLLPEWKDDARSKITLTNLMHMNSGLSWNEAYGNRSDVTLMLYNYADMAAYAYNKKAVVKPDSIWYYSSGTSNIVSYIIRKTIGNDSAYYAFPRKELFNPCDMRSVIFETDASGTFAGSSYLYATMRDYVRFGLLYLNKGNWLGKQILPIGWTDYTATPAKGSKGKYGAFFWLNRDGRFKGVPKDLYYCDGHDGQYIFIIPSLKLVVVRTGFSKKGDFNREKFLASIVNCIK